MILAGDIGGTKTNVALFTAGPGGRPERRRAASYASQEQAGLVPILADFLGTEADRREITAACFGIAGPVIANRSQTPNLAWVVDGAEVAAAIGVGHVELINDLVATAEGIPALAPDELATLAPGRPAAGGNAVLIAAGTGLGMTVIARPAGGWLPLASEGGHSDFAARTDEEIGLLRHLRERYGRVSVERVVSGPGLANVYDYLRASGRGAETPEVASRIASAQDPSPAIAEAALAGASALCGEALGLFVGAYGAVAGDLGLIGLATGGVYLGGGIAPKLLPALSDGRFLAAFRAKGRFEPLLADMPVAVILNQETALLGAARRALGAAR